MEETPLIVELGIIDIIHSYLSDDIWLRVKVGERYIPSIPITPHTVTGRAVDVVYSSLEWIMVKYIISQPQLLHTRTGKLHGCNIINGNTGTYYEYEGIIYRVYSGDDYVIVYACDPYGGEQYRIVTYELYSSISYFDTHRLIFYTKALSSGTLPSLKALISEKPNYTVINLRDIGDIFRSSLAVDRDPPTSDYGCCKTYMDKSEIEQYIDTKDHRYTPMTYMETVSGVPGVKDYQWTRVDHTKIFLNIPGKKYQYCITSGYTHPSYTSTSEGFIMVAGGTYITLPYSILE